MPDAYTYTNGSESRTFKSRKELYDYMVERGEIILEGDDAVKFEEHCKKKDKDSKAQLALEKINSLR